MSERTLDQYSKFYIIYTPLVMAYYTDRARVEESFNSLGVCLRDLHMYLLRIHGTARLDVRSMESSLCIN